MVSLTSALLPLASLSLSLSLPLDTASLLGLPPAELRPLVNQIVGFEFLFGLEERSDFRVLELLGIAVGVHNLEEPKRRVV
jgi:hypothetical protein